MSTGRQLDPGAVSPVRSVAAVSLGWGAFVVLQTLGPALVYGLFPAHFPHPPAGTDLATLDPLTYMPTPTGLAMAALLHGVNAAAGGVITSRVAGYGFRWHGLALASLLGLFGALAMGGLRGYPGWFALATLFGAPLGVMIGTLAGELAFHRHRRASIGHNG